MGSNSDSLPYQASSADQIGELHVAMRRLMAAEDQSEVAAVAVETNSSSRFALSVDGRPPTANAKP